ncbi:aspartate aminotransferase, partial [Cladophialophora psammophila CBS 110553]
SSPLLCLKSIFGSNLIPKAPEDPLYGLVQHQADECPTKVHFGVGACRDDNAKPWILSVVKKATAILRPFFFHEDLELNHEYIPIAGLIDFNAAT